MPRIRETDIPYHSELPPGPLNALTDVPGTAVGHTTLIQGEGDWNGNGPFRTGVTVILPHTGNLYAEKVPAAVHAINGYGKATGFEQIREIGTIETPIALTGTLNVPRVADALITLAIEQNPYIGLGFPGEERRGYPTVNPVVGEISDGFLSDIQARPIGLEEVRAAVENAHGGPVEEGSVGGGTGASCFGWKGGIGTASRVLPQKAGGFTIGALVQTNYGRPEQLVIAGVPIGRHLHPPDYQPRREGGSVMIILATDAPLESRQLERLCRRATFGLARSGSICHGVSGDFVIAFSTGYRVLDQPTELLTTRPAFYLQPVMHLFSLAVIEAVEEAIYNSMLTATTTVGRDGHTRYALPVEEVTRLMKAYGRHNAAAVK